MVRCSSSRLHDVKRGGTAFENAVGQGFGRAVAPPRAMVMNMVTKAHTALPAQISAGAFKATCLELMDAVERTGSSVVVTKRGRAVAQLAPVRSRPRSAFGLLKGRIHVKGDIVAPIDVHWTAAK